MSKIFQVVVTAISLTIGNLIGAEIFGRSFSGALEISFFQFIAIATFVATWGLVERN